MNNNIWKYWTNHYQSLGIDPSRISKDGIIKTDRFNRSYRILFVLKETNGFAGGSLSELLKDGPVYQMWHTAARWAAGILYGFPEYQQINNYDTLTTALHQIAVINLKKATGGSSANMTIVEAYAHQDKDLLLKQIKTIDPDIILACGTFEPLIWLLDLPVKGDNPYERPIKSKIIDSLIIPWRHPNRVNNKATYKELKNIFEKEKIKMPVPNKMQKTQG